MAPKQQSVKRNSPVIPSKKRKSSKSTLTEEDVKKLMKKYKISSFSALAAGDALANNPPPKHIAVYEHTLSNGLFFPLSSFISSTLRKLGVPIVLLPPNAIKMLVGFEMLCFYHGIPCNFSHFVQLFRLARVKKQIYFQSRSVPIHYNVTDYHKGWKKNFFFLKYDMGMFPQSPVSDKDLEKYRLDREYPDVYAKFQGSRVMDLSKGWDNSLVRDYLRLARASEFTEYTWRSESCRLRALSRWKKAFEQRSICREEYEKIGDQPTVRPVGDGVGHSDAQEEIHVEGEEDFSEDRDCLPTRKRRISEIQTTKEPTKAKIHSCSTISNQDIEGHNVELDAVSGHMLSGGLARTPITPLGRIFFKKNMPPVGESSSDSFAADMGKLTEKFLSSVMEREEKLIKEKLAQSKEALDAKIAECQAWEEKFIASQKEHERILSKQAEEYKEKLSKCQDEHALALSKQKENLLEGKMLEFNIFKENLALVKEALDGKRTECKAWEERFNMSQEEYEKTLKQVKENNQKLDMCTKDYVLATSKQKEYEKLLEYQRSESRILKKNLAELKESLNVRTAECEGWKKKFHMSQQVYEDKLIKQDEEYNQNLEQCVHEKVVALKKEQDYEKLLEGQRSELKMLKEQKEAAETSLNELKASFHTFFTRYEEKARTSQRK